MTDSVITYNVGTIPEKKEKKEKLGSKLLRNFFSPLKIEKYYLPTSSLLVIFKLKFLKLRKTSGSVEGATFSTFRIGNFQNEFPTIYDCREKIKERREKGEGKKIPYIKGNIADSIHSFFLPPFFHGAHRIFACFQFLARLRLATTTTSSHKRQTYWKTRLGSGFTSELSSFWFPSKGEPRSLAKFLARIFVSVLTRHHRMAVSHETNSIFSE